MPRSKCPDPALLQAYADGTLFSRDVPAVEQHIVKCEKCGALLTAIRNEGDGSPATTWSRLHIFGTVGAAIVVGGIATWAVWPRGNDAPVSEAATASQPAPAAASPPVAPVESPAPAPEPAPAPAPKTAPAPTPATPTAKRAAPVAAKRPQPGVKETPPPADANPPVESAALDGVVLRGTRRSNRGVIWRARDLTIEHSTDGGMTWSTEYTADRAIRAGAFVSADVAWLVGDGGLILRRTKNGWFGATPPAEGNIKSVRASSSSKATVTFEDGQVFATENGGVTWSLSP